MWAVHINCLSQPCDWCLQVKALAKAAKETAGGMPIALGGAGSEASQQAVADLCAFIDQAK